MNDKPSKTVAAKVRRSIEPCQLSAFDEIALTCVKLGRRNRGSVTALQDYLDGRITIDGVSWRRRAVLLSVHDMTEEKEAPLTLQYKVLALVDGLQMFPIPPLSHYRDIATALLRMEVVIRLSPAKAPHAAERWPLLSFALIQQGRDEARRAVAKSLALLGAAKFASAAALCASLAQLRGVRLTAPAVSAERYHGAANFRTAIRA